MCEPNLLSSKPSMSMLSVGPSLSLSGFKRIHHAAVAWLSKLPVLYRTYNLHTIIQLEEMNFAKPSNANLYYDSEISYLPYIFSITYNLIC